MHANDNKSWSHDIVTSHKAWLQVTVISHGHNSLAEIMVAYFVKGIGKGTAIDLITDTGQKKAQLQ